MKPVGYVSARGLQTELRVLFWVALVPLLGLLAMPWVVETRDGVLAD